MKEDVPGVISDHHLYLYCLSCASPCPVCRDSYTQSIGERAGQYRTMHFVIGGAV